MTRAWCPGSRRAVPGHATQYNPTGIANCPVCGLRLNLVAGRVSKHRRRGCLVAGCDSPQTGGGLCTFHNKDIVGVPG